MQIPDTGDDCKYIRLQKKQEICTSSRPDIASLSRRQTYAMKYSPYIMAKQKVLEKHSSSLRGITDYTSYKEAAKEAKGLRITP